MSAEVWAAIIAGVASVVGIIITVIATNKVTLYRIGELEKKQEKYNHLQERVLNREMHDIKYDERIQEMRDDIKQIKRKMFKEQ